MSQTFEVHPTHPQPRLLKLAAQILHDGGVAAVPTDSSYALACHLDDKSAAEALRRIRGVDARHHLTLLCRDLSELATYARVDNQQYRLLKRATPGPYTFILEATREVPRRLSHPSRRTIGLRVPDHPVTQALLQTLGQPLLATTLIPPGVGINRCGDIFAGDCFVAHTAPACDDEICCRTVCSIDAYCCTSTWDANCALVAQQNCVNCNASNGTACPGDLNSDGAVDGGDLGAMLSNWGQCN